MSVHRLHARQVVPASVEDAYAFFATPRNLHRLTPPGLDLRIRSDDTEMRVGLAIDYRLRPLFGIPVGWQTRIVRLDPPNGFADVQVRGPYRRWEHVHTFRAVSGGTEIVDDVTYEVPFGPIGEVVHRLLVRGRLEGIFRFRARAIAGILAANGAVDPRLTVAVAGGTGFVGGAIAQAVARRGHDVIVLSHRGEAARGDLPDRVQLRVADVTAGAADLEAALRGADALAIALAFPNSPIEAPRRGRTFEAVDARGTERLVEAARRAGVARILYVSGAGAAPGARRHWFRAKWRAEEAVRGSGLAWTIVRPTWIYGPRDVSLNRFVGFARRLGLVPMTGTGSQLLAPVFVDDVAGLVADALVDPAAAGQVFEIGGPETLTMREIIARALAAAGLRRPILPGPAPLLKLLARPLRLLPSPPLTPDAIDFINQPATVDVAPLLARMPRRLTPLSEGLASYLAPGSGPGSISIV